MPCAALASIAGRRARRRGRALIALFSFRALGMPNLPAIAPAGDVGHSFRLRKEKQRGWCSESAKKSTKRWRLTLRHGSLWPN